VVSKEWRSLSPAQQIPAGITYAHLLNKGYEMDKRRLSIEISVEDQIRMRNLVPWGLMGRIVRMLFIQVLDLLDEHGDIVLGALLSGKLTALDLLKKKGEESGSDRPT
jgi:hypothetical protein